MESMNKELHTPWVVCILVSLVIGVGFGYWYGMTKGKETGRMELLAEQQKAQEEEKKKAQEEVIQAANPFKTENPLEGGYQNPFKQNVNPFAQ